MLRFRDLGVNLYIKTVLHDDRLILYKQGIKQIYLVKVVFAIVMTYYVGVFLPLTVTVTLSVLISCFH